MVSIKSILLSSTLLISFCAAPHVVASPSHDLRVAQKLEFSRLSALSDPYNRFGPDFKIPKAFKRRVSFWFDIYTKFDSSKHVIHHSRHPWIVYKVVDTSKIMMGKGNHWTKYHRAQKFVKKEKRRIRNAIKSLAKRKNYKKLPTLEKNLYKILSHIGGKRKSVFRTAAKTLRSQLGQKDFFIKGITNSGKYLKHMEAEFRRQKLPLELTRLPFVESSFNESARSKVGASGVWQIMPRTGRALGRVNKSIDERNSPLKATVMAGKVLKQNYRSLKDWPLAITAYNHGIGYLKRSIKKAGSRKLSTIITRYRGGSFKFASSNFYASFMAALYAEGYHREIFKKTILTEPALKYELVHIPKSIRIKKLMRLSGLKKKEILNLNLDLRNAIAKNSHIPAGHKLYVPVGTADLLSRKLAVSDIIKKISSRTLKKRSASYLPRSPDE